MSSTNVKLGHRLTSRRSGVVLRRFAVKHTQ